MRIGKTIYKGFLVILASVLFMGIAHAIPMAEIKYYETDLGSGWWQYDYTVYNTSDPILDAGYDIYDIFSIFDDTATIIPLAAPLGWDGIIGSGFVAMFSLNAGAPPVGTDIAPDTYLSGFSLMIDYRVGDSYFEALFSNPDNPENPVLFSGMTTAHVSIPEPATLFILGAGISGLFFLKKKGKSLRLL